MPESIPIAALSFLAALVLFFLLVPVSGKFGLVDRPDKRKPHEGEVPLIGGITIYLTVLLGILLAFPADRNMVGYLVAAGILVLVGAIDDKRGLDFRIRVVSEVIAASIMILVAGLWVGNVGDLLGFGEIHMPYWVSYIFTLVAVFGIVNAINMIDGLDGLAAGLSLITLLILVYFTGISHELNAVGPLMAGAIAAFLVFNLTLIPFVRKVFLGDAGSKLLGFTLVWFLIDVAKSGYNVKGGIDPATALYFVAIPLFDMVTITLRRVKQGLSPFEPDRNHIHHVVMALGFSGRQTLIIILFADIAIKLLGIAMSKLNIAEYIQFLVFFLMFALYFYLVHRLDKAVLQPQP